MVVRKREPFNAHQYWPNVLIPYIKEYKEPITAANLSVLASTLPQESYELTRNQDYYSFLKDERKSFKSAACGNVEASSSFVNETFTSPLTGKVYPTLLHVSEDCVTPRLQLLHSIKCARVTDTSKHEAFDTTISFFHLSSRMMMQVNAFLCQFFWKDIDVTESLEYPEFSVIAFYKRLVVGVALMTPTGYISYFAVHPDWQKSRIGSIMLYFLIQSCPPPLDVTLHVSVTNPALILYQKFGFKPEQFIINFYDKYLSSESSNVSKNAFFIRLKLRHKL